MYASRMPESGRTPSAGLPPFSSPSNASRNLSMLSSTPLTEPTEGPAGRARRHSRGPAPRPCAGRRSGSPPVSRSATSQIADGETYSFLTLVAQPESAITPSISRRCWSLSRRSTPESFSATSFSARFAATSSNLLHAQGRDGRQLRLGRCGLSRAGCLGHLLGSRGCGCRLFASDAAAMEHPAPVPAPHLRHPPRRLPRRSSCASTWSASCAASSNSAVAPVTHAGR